MLSERGGCVDQTISPEAVSTLLDWFRANARDLPWRHTSDPYRIWVSEIMLQQTRVETVKAYYLRFIRRFQLDFHFPVYIDGAGMSGRLCGQRL